MGAFSQYKCGIWLRDLTLQAEYDFLKVFILDLFSDSVSVFFVYTLTISLIFVLTYSIEIQNKNNLSFSCVMSSEFKSKIIDKCTIRPHGCKYFIWLLVRR